MRTPIFPNSAATAASRIAGTDAEGACGLILNVNDDDHAVGRTTRRRRDVHCREVAKRLQAALGARDHFLVEGITLTDIELASRLSFFLWGSIPDDELLTVAAASRLSRPDVLAAQVTRMLADARAKSLSDDFAYQWLNIAKIDEIAPDRGQFPFASGLLDARALLKQELKLFVDSILRSDRSVKSGSRTVNGVAGPAPSGSGSGRRDIRPQRIPPTPSGVPAGLGGGAYRFSFKRDYGVRVSPNDGVGYYELESITLEGGGGYWTAAGGLADFAAGFVSPSLRLGVTANQNSIPRELVFDAMRAHFDDARVDVDLFIYSHATELSFFKDAKELDLERRTRFSHLVQ